MRIIGKLKRILGVKKSHLQYWEQRAKSMGERSVVSVKYQSPVNEITDYQERQIFPFLVNSLQGNEKVVLDFGCGSGRFTKRLAEVTGAKVIGLDPTKSLIELAQKIDSNSIYIVLRNNKIPFEDGAVDIIWVCLVLGGIPDSQINTIVSEIERVLRPGGLLMLTENTSSIANSEYWSYRRPELYIDLFKSVDLTVAGNYKELDEDITIMTGRKKK